MTPRIAGGSSTRTRRNETCFRHASTALRRWWPWAVVAATALLTVMTVYPQALGVQRWLPATQLVAMRPLSTILLTVVGLAVLLVALLRAGRHRVLLTVGAILLSGAVAGAAVIGTRGHAAIAQRGGPENPDDIVVLSWNTEVGSPDVDLLAALIVAADVDVVTLAETKSDYAGTLGDAVTALGHPMAAGTVDTDGVWTSTSILIADGLGEYRLDSSAGGTPILPSGLWVPVDGTGPSLVAAHPVPPMPWSMFAWSHGLDWLADRCADPSVIVAGDFNATLDHWDGTNGGPGTGCADAASVVGATAIGTWPTSLPPALGTPIDRVLAGSEWTVVGYEVLTDLDDAGSDHRPVLATLRAASS